MAKQLYGKYNVTKANGEPTDPDAQYFVLRIDTDPAAMMALGFYAAVQPDSVFREELQSWMNAVEAIQAFGGFETNVPRDWHAVRKEFEELLSKHQRALKAYENIMNRDTEGAVSEAYSNLLYFIQRLHGV